MQEDWTPIDIAPRLTRGDGSARVTLSLRKASGARDTVLYVSLNAPAVQALGWTPKQRVAAASDRSGALLRLAAGPTGRHLAAQPGGGLRLALPLPWLAEAKPQGSEAAAHRIEAGALIVTLAAWARAPAPATAAPAAPAPVATPVAPAPAAPVPRTETSRAFPEAPPLDARIDAADVKEAEQMVAAGQGARALAEYFGWPLEAAQGFAARVRAQQPARGRAA